MKKFNAKMNMDFITFPADWDDEFSSMISLMLDFDPDERPSLSNILQTI